MRACDNGASLGGGRGGALEGGCMLEALLTTDLAGGLERRVVGRAAAADLGRAPALAMRRGHKDVPTPCPCRHRRRKAQPALSAARSPDTVRPSIIAPARRRSCLSPGLPWTTSPPTPAWRGTRSPVQSRRRAPFCVSGRSTSPKSLVARGPLLPSRIGTAPAKVIGDLASPPCRGRRSPVQAVQGAPSKARVPRWRTRAALQPHHHAE